MRKKKTTAALLIAAAMAGLCGTAAAAPSTAYCLDATRVSTLTDSGGPFDGGTRIGWAASAGCPGVAFTLGGVAVASSGSVVRDPQLTTRYTLTAHLNGQSKNLGSRIAVGGELVGYFWSPAQPLREFTGPGAAEAAAFAAPVVNSLSSAAKTGLLGKRISIHLIPTYFTLTSLAPWQHLNRSTTCDGAPAGCVDDRPWSEVRGAGGTLVPGTPEIAMAAGVETLMPTQRGSDTEYGHLLVHELGHTILDHAVPATEPAIAGLLTQRGPNADYLGRDSYTKSTPDEYWAEGTAALFGLGGPRVIVTSWQRRLADEYSETWLSANDPALLERLNAVYPRR